MPDIKDIPPTLLHTRHRMSTGQINLLLGRKALKETFEEKKEALKKLAEFIRLTDIFRSENIDFVPLKGPLLSLKLYSDATFRNFNDLDILVDDFSLGKVRNILIETGYTSEGRTWPSTPGNQQRLLKHRHQISFNNPDLDIIVEIHWFLMDRQMTNFINTSDFVKENLSVIEMAGRSFNVLNDEAELLYLVMHGGFHKWGRLKWLSDVNAYLVNRKIKKEKFCEFINKFQAGRLVGLCNTMLEEYFPGGPLLPCSEAAPGFLKRYSKEKVQGIAYPDVDSFYSNFLLLRFAMRAYPGLRYKVRLAGDMIERTILVGKVSNLFHGKKFNA